MLLKRWTGVAGWRGLAKPPHRPKPLTSDESPFVSGSERSRAESQVPLKPLQAGSLVFPGGMGEREGETGRETGQERGPRKGTYSCQGPP